MANYATLTAWIEAYIKTNGQQAITGQVLQTTLKKMVSTLGDGFRLAGVATPEGTPAATDNDIYYLAAEAGTYTNYGGAVLDGSTLHLLTYSSEWGDIDTGLATATALAAVAQALGADIEAVAEVKADKASSNPAMLVGSALGILGNTPQAALYTHRAVPAGAGSGAAQMRLLRGRSIVWNQLVGADTESVTIPSGHKYYAVIGGVASVGTSDGTAIAVTGGTDMVVDLTTLTMPDLTAPAFEALYPGFHGYNSGVIKNLTATGVQSDGFNQWDEEYQKGTYSIVDGETYSPDASFLCSKNKIHVIPGENYYFLIGTVFRYFFYDVNGVFITTDTMNGNSVLPIPNNVHYIHFQLAYSGEYANDICINISWSGYRNGEYEQHWESTMNLPITTMTGVPVGGSESVTIYPNGMMSAGAAYDYGRVDADGWMRKMVKVMGIIDLGSLTGWTIRSGTTDVCQILFVGSQLAYNTANAASTICARYATTTVEDGSETLSLSDKHLALYSNNTNPEGRYIYIKDSGISASDIVDDKVAKLNGIYLVYPLSTPIEYVLDTPIYMGYPVDADGTETMLPDQTGLSEPTSAPIDYDVVYPIQTATPSDIATAIAAAKAEEVTALNSMLTANELGGEFSVDEDGVLTYTPGE